MLLASKRGLYAVIKVKTRGRLAGYGRRKREGGREGGREKSEGKRQMREMSERKRGGEGDKRNKMIEVEIDRERGERNE